MMPVLMVDVIVAWSQRWPRRTDRRRSTVSGRAGGRTRPGSDAAGTTRARRTPTRWTTRWSGTATRTDRPGGVLGRRRAATATGTRDRVEATGCPDTRPPRRRIEYSSRCSTTTRRQCRLTETPSTTNWPSMRDNCSRLAPRFYQLRQFSPNFRLSLDKTQIADQFMKVWSIGI